MPFWCESAPGLGLGLEVLRCVHLSRTRRVERPANSVRRTHMSKQVGILGIAGGGGEAEHKQAQQKHRPACRLSSHVCTPGKGADPKSTSLPSLFPWPALPSS